MSSTANVARVGMQRGAAWTRPWWIGVAILACTSTAISAGSAVDQAAPPAAPATPAPATSVPSADRSAVGFWQGMVLAGNGALFVRVDAKLDGAHGVAKVTLPQAMALNQAAEEVTLDGAKLSFLLKAGGLSGRFEGEVDATNKEFAGNLTLSGGSGEPLVVPFTLGRTGDAKTTPGSERWEGILDVGQKLPLSITLADDTNFGPLGAIDIPAQSLENFPLLVTKAADGKVTIRIPVGAEAVLELAPKDGQLVGEMRQAGRSFPLTLTRAGAGGAPVAGLARPQIPTPPFPYTVREVTIPHRFGHSLSGTLTLPKREAGAPETKFPAVVLVSGSGPQDRDETLFGHKPFLVIADALTRAGIAVLRYDDRGVGRSTGQFGTATSHDFATDCDEATEFLRRQVDIDATRIGIIGHSEGGLIAPMVAKWQWEEGDPATAVRFLVLLAGPGVNGRDVLALQMRKLMEAEGATPEEVEAVSVLQTTTMDAIRAEKKPEEILPLVRALVAKQLDVAAAHGRAEPGADIEALSQGAMGELASPWMRTFLAHEPREWIAALPIPVLAMQGGLDKQVDPDQNLPAIEAAAKEGNVPLTVKRYPTLNHLFQPAKSGSVEEYSQIEVTFDPVALKDLVDWVVKNAADPSLTKIKPKKRVAPIKPIEGPINPIIVPAKPQESAPLGPQGPQGAPAAPAAPKGSN